VAILEQIVSLSKKLWLWFAPPARSKDTTRHVILALVALLLAGHALLNFERFGLSVMLVANLALVGGVTWHFVHLARHYRRQDDAGFAIVKELKLERDPSREGGNGGYPCDGVWRCYRGMFDGARIQWLKVWVGSSQRGGTVWIASTEIVPAFDREFRIDASYAAEPVPAPHPRLPANRELWWEPRAWVGPWLDSLPEAAAAALHAFLRQDEHTVVTGRLVFCFVGELADAGPPAALAAFSRIVALARLLSASASETNVFDIHTSFHYVRYQEGKNSFELAIDPGENSSWVYVPTPANWPKQVPAWAAGRREEIVARLRAHLSKEFEFIAS